MRSIRTTLEQVFADRAYVLRLLILRDIKIRYKAPWLGVLWAFVVPLAISLILMMIFGRLIPVASSPAQFFLFVATAMFPWNFFQVSVATSTTSLQDNAELIQKVAFPRAIVPLAIVGAQGFNFLCALLVLTALVWMTVPATWWVLVLPCAVVLHGLFTVGMAWLVAGLQASYRDVKYLVEVGLWLWFYVTPVFYPLVWVQTLSRPWRLLYLANPMVGLVSLFRVALLGPASAGFTTAPSLLGCMTAAVLGSLLMALIGWQTFRSYEPALADLIQ